MDDMPGEAGDAPVDGVGAHVDVVALALGDVDGLHPPAMARHLLRCATCRREYDETVATIGALLPAVPAVQPPLGFDQRVLERLAVAPPRERHRPARAGRTRAWLVAAAALLVLASGAVGWWVVASRGPDRAGIVSPLELSGGGGRVGTVSVAEVDGEAVMVVAILAASDGVSYRCRTTLADGTTIESRAWPPGNGAWIVPVPGASASAIAHVELLVDGTDHVWSTASFVSS